MSYFIQDGVEQPFTALAFVIGAVKGYIITQEQLNALESIGFLHIVEDTNIDGVRFIRSKNKLCSTNKIDALHIPTKREGPILWATPTKFALSDQKYTEIENATAWWVPRTTKPVVTIGPWHAFCDPARFGEIALEYFSHRRSVILRYTSSTRSRATDADVTIELGLIRSEYIVQDIPEILGVQGPWAIWDHKQYSGDHKHTYQNHVIAVTSPSNITIMVELTENPRGPELFSKILEMARDHYLAAEETKLKLHYSAKLNKLEEEAKVLDKDIALLRNSLIEKMKRAVEMEQAKSLYNNPNIVEYFAGSKLLKSWTINNDGTIRVITAPIHVRHTSGTLHDLGCWTIMLDGGGYFWVKAPDTQGIPVEGGVSTPMAAPHIYQYGHNTSSPVEVEPDVVEAFVGLLNSGLYKTAFELVIQWISDCGKHIDRILHWPLVDEKSNFNWDESKLKKKPYPEYRRSYRLLELFRTKDLFPPDGDCTCGHCRRSLEEITVWLYCPADHKEMLRKLIEILGGSDKLKPWVRWLQLDLVDSQLDDVISIINNDTAEDPYEQDVDQPPE